MLPTGQFHILRGVPRASTHAKGTGQNTEGHRRRTDDHTRQPSHHLYHQHAHTPHPTQFYAPNHHSHCPRRCCPRHPRARAHPRPPQFLSAPDINISAYPCIRPVSNNNNNNMSISQTNSQHGHTSHHLATKKKKRMRSNRDQHTRDGASFASHSSRCMHSVGGGV